VRASRSISLANREGAILVKNRVKLSQKPLDGACGIPPNFEISLRLAVPVSPSFTPSILCIQLTAQQSASTSRAGPSCTSNSVPSPFRARPVYRAYRQSSLICRQSSTGKSGYGRRTEHGGDLRAEIEMRHLLGLALLFCYLPVHGLDRCS
jgi:hypothetical protein